MPALRFDAGGDRHGPNSGGEEDRDQDAIGPLHARDRGTPRRRAIISGEEAYAREIHRRRVFSLNPGLRAVSWSAGDRSGFGGPWPDRIRILEGGSWRRRSHHRHQRPQRRAGVGSGGRHTWVRVLADSGLTTIAPEDFAADAFRRGDSGARGEYAVASAPHHLLRPGRRQEPESRLPRETRWHAFR